MFPLSAVTSFEGRMRRQTYWLASTVWVLAYVGLLVVLIEYVSESRWLDEDYGKDPQSGRDFGLVGLITDSVLLYPGMAIAWQRLHDLGRSGIWFLPVVALNLTYGVISYAGLTGPLDQETPLGQIALNTSIAVQLAVILVLGCLPGTRGHNQYGADPRPGDVDA